MVPNARSELLGGTLQSIILARGGARVLALVLGPAAVVDCRCCVDYLDSIISKLWHTGLTVLHSRMVWYGIVSVTPIGRVSWK